MPSGTPWDCLPLSCTPRERGRSLSSEARSTQSGGRIQCTQAEARRNWAAGIAAPRQGRRSAELRPDDAVRVDLAVERLGIDREQGGGLTAVTVHLPEHRDDVLALHRLEATAGRR